LRCVLSCSLFFFFQAEDGIRDFHVTGVQTCALPISASLTVQENADPDVVRDLQSFFERVAPEDNSLYVHTAEGSDDMPAHIRSRSEERRVGKECSTRGAP